MLSSPPVMSLTFWAKSSAYSWNISTVGHVLWKRKVVGPCALAIMGKPMVAAAAVPATAPPRKLRRVELDTLAESVCFVSSFITCLQYLNKCYFDPYKSIAFLLFYFVL